MLTRIPPRCSWWVPALAAIVVPAAAHAGQNLGAYARLSWSLTDTTLVDRSGESERASLFLHVERPDGVTFKGAQVDLSWYPVTGCIDPVGAPVFVSATGSDCTALNRDSTVCVQGPDSAGHLFVAWAHPTSATGCTSGAVLRLDFSLDDCEDAAGCFVLNSVLLLDDLNEVDVCGLLGWRATVNGGSQTCVTMNHAPVLARIGPRTVRAEQVLYFPVTGVDPDCTIPTYGAVGLPAGAIMGERSFTWTPTLAQVGEYDITFFARDAQGAADSEIVHVTATSEIDCRLRLAPVFTCGGDTTVVAGGLVTFAVCVADWDADSLRVAIGAMPPSAQFDGHTFTWQTQDADVGTTLLWVTASNRCRETVQVRGIFVTPLPCAGNLPPTARDTTYTLVEGDSAYIVLPVADADDGIQSLKWQSGGLPAGVQSQDGFIVSGRPLPGSAGSYTIVIVVGDGCSASATGTFRFEVVPAPEPPPDSAPPAAAPSFAVCPSVAQTGVDVRVEVATGMRADAAVFDMRGVRVCTLPLEAEGSACTGHWSLADGQGRRVAAGLYVVRVLTGTDVRTQRVYVTR